MLKIKYEKNNLSRDKHNDLINQICADYFLLTK